MTPKIIYDVGANNGDDVQYYLNKADVVVAIEANPTLADGIRSRFAKEIESGRVIVVNGAALPGDVDREITFYVHRDNHLLSSATASTNDQDFDVIKVQGYALVNLIRRYGRAYYVKIDVEGFDFDLAKSLFDNEIIPDFISVEAHDPAVAALLMSVKRYKSYNLIEGSSVGRVYANARIAGRDGQPITYRFPNHSAGPFGSDIGGSWLTRSDLFRRLAVVGFGWKDIHASTDIEPSGRGYDARELFIDSLLMRLRFVPYRIRRAAKRALGR